MARIDKSTTRPVDDLAAIERAFESLLESTELVYPDGYIELRGEMMEASAAEYRSSGAQFRMQELLSTFADRIWGFAVEIAERDGKFSRESVFNAFQSFVKSGGVFLEGNSPVPGDLLSLVSGPRFNYLLINTQIISSNLSAAAEFLIEGTSEVEKFSERLDGLQSLAKEGDKEATTLLSEMILGDGLVDKMAALSHAFEDFYFGPFIERVGAHAERARESYEKGELALFTDSMNDIGEIYTGIMKAYENMRDVHNALSRTLTIIKKSVDEEDEGILKLLRRHRAFMANYAAVGHDYSNLLSAINGHIQLMELDDDKLDQLIALEGVCLRHRCTNILMLLELVGMSKSDSELDADGMEEVRIPRKYRRLLFRSVFELVRNAKKYMDPEKKERWIKIGATRKGGFTEIVVEDNGVGIEDVDVVLNEGVRERPDLAEGFGIGLPSIAKIAEENPWEFKIVSTPRVGTKATIRIDESKWVDGAGGSGGGGMLIPYAPLIAGASVFLGMGVI